MKAELSSSAMLRSAYCSHHRRFGKTHRFYLHGSSSTSGADNSLARPGRKQAAATKLDIYSTYSQRSSIHLTRCSKFCKPLKKIRILSNQVSAAAMTFALDEKWRNFDCFSVQGKGGSPTEPDPESRGVIKILEA